MLKAAGALAGSLREYPSGRFEAFAAPLGNDRFCANATPVFVRSRREAGIVDSASEFIKGRPAFGVTSGDRSPTGPRIGANGAAADHVGPIHFPDHGLAARVLKKDVGMAVAVEVAGSDDAPTRPGIGADRPAAD
jgi:hypothetical protein